MIPAVQTKIKYLIVENLEDRLNCNVSIGHFSFVLPKSLEVNELLISKNESDTLLYLDKFSVNIRIYTLLRKQIVIQNIDLENGNGDFGKLIDQIPADTTNLHPYEKELRTSKPWRIQLDNLAIESCHFKYRDEIKSGFDMDLDIGKARLQIASIDPATLFSFKSIEFENTYFGYKSLFPSNSKNDSISAANDFANIHLEETFLKNVEFRYMDSSGVSIFNITSNNLEVSNLLVGINNEAVIFDEGLAGQTKCVVSSASANDDPSTSNENMNWGESLWRVEGKELELKDFNFLVKGVDKPGPGKKSSDDTFIITGLNGHLANFIVDQDILNVELKEFSGKDINGFEIVKLDAVMEQDDSLFSIKDLEFQTPISEYGIDLTTEISPTNYLALDGKSIVVGLDIKSKNLYEIESFFSLVEKYDFLSKDLMNKSFELHTQISGDVDNLNIEEFNFLYSDSTQIIARGRITEPSEPDSLQLAIHIDKLMAPKSILEIGLKDLITDSPFSAPEYLLVDGIYKSSDDEHHISGNIESNVGEIQVSEGIVDFRDIPKFRVTASANLRNLNTITETDLNNVAFTVDALYKGEDFYAAESNFDFRLDSLTYDTHKYGKLEMTGEVTNGHFEAKINSLDKNFLFNLSTVGDYFHNNLKVNIDTDFERIDLGHLNIYDEPLTIEGKARFNIDLIDQNDFSVNSTIHKLELCLNDTPYKMFPAELFFETNDFKTDLNFKSQYVNFVFEADDNIMELMNSFENLPAYYLADNKDDSYSFTMPAFNIEGQIDSPDTTASFFFPELPEFHELSVVGAYDKSIDQLYFDLSIPGIRYDVIFIDSLFLSVSGSSVELNFDSKISFHIKDIMEGVLGINGNFNNSALVTNLNYSDAFSNRYLNITARLKKEEDKILVNLLPEMLILGYEQWELNPDNQFIFSPTSFELNNFDFINNGQQVSLSSFTIGNTQNAELNIKDFNLNSLDQLHNLETLVAGNLNANLKILDVLNIPSFEGNMTVDSIYYQGFDAGKFTLSEFIYKDYLARAEMALKGKNCYLRVSGSYDNNKPRPMDLTLDINQLDLSDLNNMLSDYIKDATGNLKGRILLEGSFEEPVFNGSLGFEDAATEIIFLQKEFRLGNETITIEDNVIDFGGLSIVNEHNQSAKIIGQVSFANGKMPYSDLHVVTDNMKIFNSTRRENELLYGVLKALSDIKISGYSDQLKVDANMEIDRTSDITYVFPDILAVNSSNSIVMFGSLEDDSIDESKIPKTTAFLGLESFDDVRSQVRINNGAKINLFFDRNGNNFLEAAINGTVNHRLYKGVTEISGRLEVNEGQLRYSIPMVTAKDYQIESGSFITLSNDVYNPYVNIIASTQVRASTEGLLDDHNRVLNFKVLLYLSGRLNDLILKFDISPDINDAVVSSRLALLTEQERNVNALNLLARGTFVVSVEGREAGSTSMVDAQVDRFLTNQLNYLVSDNIQFVDLRFDVQSFMDYGSMDRMVLQRNYYYNVGKSFLSDRVRVNYTGSMEFTSNMFSEQLHSSFVQNEFDVEIKIDKEGTFRGVFFRKNKYEGILEGEVVETGGGIRIIKNFDSVKDIFTRDKKSDKDTNNKEPEIEIE